MHLNKSTIIFIPYSSGLSKVMPCGECNLFCRHWFTSMVARSYSFCFDLISCYLISYHTILCLSSSSSLTQWTHQTSSSGHLHHCSFLLGSLWSWSLATFRTHPKGHTLWEASTITVFYIAPFLSPWLQATLYSITPFNYLFSQNFLLSV